MKNILSAVLSLFICSFIFAQTSAADSTAKANAEKQATKMATLLLKKDYKGFSAYTYHTIVKMMGGLDKMASYMQKSFKDMETEGYTIDTVTIKDCSNITHTATQLQCTLTEVIELSYTKGKLIQQSTLIGMSNNKGVNWTFIDTHGASLAQLQKTVKELSNTLIIPEQPKPVLVPN